jgi:hypothetical protein
VPVFVVPERPFDAGVLRVELGAQPAEFVVLIFRYWNPWFFDFFRRWVVRLVKDLLETADATSPFAFIFAFRSGFRGVFEL